MNETRSVGALATLHATVIGILVLLFLWPAGSAEPRNLPVGIVGPEQVTSQVAEQLDAKQPDAFSITQFSDEAAALAAIEEKNIYGAIVFGQEMKVIVASAANPSVAQLIRELGQSLMQLSAQQQGQMLPQLKVQEVAALPDSDPRGAVLGSSALPIVIGGISLGAMAALRLKSRSAKTSLLIISSSVAGLLVAALLQGVFGVFSNSYALNATAIAAVMAAIAFALVGMHSALGLPGFGITAATLFLLGNPLNGVALPVEFYPEGWGLVGQLMPVGAGFELIKRINFFELADQSMQWWVLAAWITVGFVLSLLRISKDKG